jgi:integral membrane protein
MTDGSEPPAPDPQVTADAVGGALTRYRVMAWAAGVGLLLLLLNMYLRYVADVETVLDLVPRIHGFVYMGYLVTVFDLAFRLRWPLRRSVLVCLAGTIPFLSFVAEQRVTQQTRAAMASAP